MKLSYILLILFGLVLIGGIIAITVIDIPVEQTRVTKEISLPPTQAP